MSDCVGRIMAKRKMAKGGMVGDDDHEKLADSDSADYDAVDADPVEFSETEANSGDDLGNAQESEDRKDAVSRIMRQRKMKQRNPSPA